MVELSIDTFKAFIKFLKNISHNYEDFVIRDGYFSIADNGGTCALVGEFEEKFSIVLSDIKSKANILATMMGSTTNKVKILLNGSEKLKEDNDDVMFYVIKFDNKEIVISKPNIIMNKEVEINLETIESNYITKLSVDTTDFVKAINILSSKFKNDIFTIDLTTDKPRLLFEDKNATMSITLQADYDKDYSDSNISILNVYNSFDIVSMTIKDKVDIIITPVENNNNLYRVIVDCEYKVGDRDILKYKIIGIGSSEQ